MSTSDHNIRVTEARGLLHPSRSHLLLDNFHSVAIKAKQGLSFVHGWKDRENAAGLTRVVAFLRSMTIATCFAYTLLSYGGLYPYRFLRTQRSGSQCNALGFCTGALSEYF